MTNPPIRQPDKVDKVLMKYYDEYNMVLRICDEKTYDIY